MALPKWEEELGISRTTSYRFRQRGWLTVLVIAGKPYVTGDAINQFLSRAKGDEFAHVPTEKGSKCKIK